MYGLPRAVDDRWTVTARQSAVMTATNAITHTAAFFGSPMLEGSIVVIGWVAQANVAAPTLYANAGTPGTQISHQQGGISMTVWMGLAGPSGCSWVSALAAASNALCMTAVEFVITKANGDPATGTILTSASGSTAGAGTITLANLGKSTPHGLRIVVWGYNTASGLVAPSGYQLSAAGGAANLQCRIGWKTADYIAPAAEQPAFTVGANPSFAYGMMVA